MAFFPKLRFLKEKLGCLTTANWFGILSMCILLATLTASLFAGQFQPDIDFLETLQKHGFECNDIGGVFEHIEGVKTLVEGIDGVNWELDVDTKVIREFVGSDISQNNYVPEGTSHVKDTAYNWDKEELKAEFDKINAKYESELKRHTASEKEDGTYMEALKGKLDPANTKLIQEGLGYATTGLGLLQSYRSNHKERLLAKKELEKTEQTNSKENSEERKDFQSSDRRTDGRFQKNGTKYGNMNKMLQPESNTKRVNKAKCISVIMIVMAIGFIAFGLGMYFHNHGEVFGQYNSAFKMIWIQGFAFLGVYGAMFITQKTNLFQTKRKARERGQKAEALLLKQHKKHLKEYFMQQMEESDGDMTIEEAMTKAKKQYKKFWENRVSKNRTIISCMDSEDSWIKKEEYEELSKAEPSQNGGQDKAEEEDAELDKAEHEEPSDQSVSMQPVNNRTAATHEADGQHRKENALPLVEMSIMAVTVEQQQQGEPSECSQSKQQGEPSEYSLSASIRPVNAGEETPPSRNNVTQDNDDADQSYAKRLGLEGWGRRRLLRPINRLMDAFQQ